MIEFIVKQALGSFLLPVGSCLILLFAGLLVLRRKHRSRLGFRLVALAAIWLLITSLPITSYFVMRPLEASAGPCADPEILKGLDVKLIVVLGGDDPGFPRVAEGVRLWRHVPGARLILSDGGPYSGSKARRFAIDMGVPRDAVIAKSGARDTSDEADLFVDTAGKSRFALVTSAYHIPRAMRLFRARGLNPVPASCEHRTKEFPPLTTCLLPNADALLTTQLALHEYLGLAWHILRGDLTKGSR